ncbi:hypothetical protein HAALTHF_45300n [Vreelandella aquamarina]|nr:hypothetical protein HAALTHF_45300n [Halomonas axialensis]
MVDRIKAAADAKLDPDFYLIARTDAFQKEGLDAAIERANACVEAGADAIFAEAVHTLDDYKAFCQRVNAPILANITEFGATPLFSQQELGEVGCRMVLYPLSAFRAMNAAALKVYQSILDNGHQREVVDTMQTRDELYDFLNYHDFEQSLTRCLPSKRRLTKASSLANSANLLTTLIKLISTSGEITWLINR